METQSPPNAAVARVLALQVEDPKRYGTQAKLAKATGLDQKSWSNYLRGSSTPSRLARQVISRKLRIAPELWDTPYRNDPKPAEVSQQVSPDAINARVA